MGVRLILRRVWDAGVRFVGMAPDPVVPQPGGGVRPVNDDEPTGDRATRPYEDEED